MSLYNDYSLQALNSCIDRIESGDKSGSCGDYSYSDDVITLSNGNHTILIMITLLVM